MSHRAILSRRLVDALNREADVLERLVAAMRSDRSAYVNLRPSVLESSVQSFEVLQREAGQCAEQRAAASSELARMLELPADARLRALIDRCPAPESSAIDRVRLRLDAAARAVQIESRVGARLLEVSRRAQDGLVQELAGIAPQSQTRVPGYNHRAQTFDPSTRAGTLVDGRV